MSRVELSSDEEDLDEIMQNTDEAGAGAPLSCEMFSLKGNCCGNTTAVGCDGASSSEGGNAKPIQGGMGIYGSIGSGS